MNIGDLSKRVALRNKLGCKNFRWYLENVFPESVMIVGSKAMGQVPITVLHLLISLIIMRTFSGSTDSIAQHQVLLR